MQFQRGKYLNFFAKFSIFSNGGHLGWWAGSSDIILKGDHPRTIPAKFFVQILLVVSEEKIKMQKVNRWTKTDASYHGGNSSNKHCMPKNNESTIFQIFLTGIQTPDTVKTMKKIICMSQARH